jgi:hypothetical protein
VTQEHDHDPELHDVVSRLESERPIPRAAFRGDLRWRLLQHEVVSRLERERPIPHAAFRGDLRRRLLQRPDGRRAAPAALRRQIFAYAGSGAALLAVAVAGVAGAGPFAA